MTNLKQFSVNAQIGKCKHSISYHNGVDTHKDGSPFFGLFIFKNKKDLIIKIKDLKSLGYTEI
jgi:hypothetical protein